MSRHHHRITPAVVLTLALAAATAPAARADPQPPARAEAAITNASINPAPGGGTCSEVCSTGGYRSLNQPPWTPSESGATLPHDPRPRSVVLASHSAGSVTTGIPARPVACDDVCSDHGYRPVTAAAKVVRIATPNGGFDWGDAGIGAGAAIVLTLVGIAGVLATINRRGRSAHHRHASADG